MIARPGPLVALCSACLGMVLVAQPASAVVKTTTDFRPPSGFGYVADGLIFPGSPYATRVVLEVRVVWDVVVDEGYNAANIDAAVWLPVRIMTPNGPSTPPVNMNGANLGWTGSGTFNYTQTINAPNMAFGTVWSGWGHQALYNGGGPNAWEAISVLPTSRIEIDYIDNIPGDTNDDGDIDDSDLGIVFGNYTGPVGNPGRKTALDGDTNGDGDVDDSDLGTALANYTGPQAPPASVPEPASLGLLALAGVALLRRRRGD